LIMIVYGVAADVSIVHLFAAGVFPGLLVAVLMMLYVMLWSVFNRSKIPAAEAGIGFIQKIRASASLIPVVVLILVVLGSIYTGLATATEAAAVGVIGALVLSAVQGSLNWQTFTASLMGATRLF